MLHVIQYVVECIFISTPFPSPFLRSSSNFSLPPRFIFLLVSSSFSFSSSCAKANMEIEAWFKIVESQSHWTGVSLEGIENIANLKSN